MNFQYHVDKSTAVVGVYELTPDCFSDSRGQIWTSFHPSYVEGCDIGGLKFEHDKFAHNSKNVLRGLHGDYKSYKVVLCPFGEVFQVALDCRENSSTFAQHHTTILSGKNRKMLLLPPGVANGFLVLSKEAVYNYKLAYTGSYADHDKQFTVRFDDPKYNIPWPKKDYILSERDSQVNA